MPPKKSQPITMCLRGHINCDGLIMEMGEWCLPGTESRWLDPDGRDRMVREINARILARDAEPT